MRFTNSEEMAQWLSCAGRGLLGGLLLNWQATGGSFDVSFLAPKRGRGVPLHHSQEFVELSPRCKLIVITRVPSLTLGLKQKGAGLLRMKTTPKAA